MASSLWAAYFVARRLRIPIVVTITVAFFGLFFLLTDTTFSYLETVVLNHFKH